MLENTCVILYSDISSSQCLVLANTYIFVYTTKRNKQLKEEKEKQQETKELFIYLLLASHWFLSS
jgi:hypothetical protein